MTLTPDQLAEWARITDAATEGLNDGNYLWMGCPTAEGGRAFLRLGEADATFIATARAAMPALIEECRRLQQAEDEADKRVCEAWDKNRDIIATLEAALRRCVDELLNYERDDLGWKREGVTEALAAARAALEEEP